MKQRQPKTPENVLFYTSKVQLAVLQTLGDATYAQEKFDQVIKEQLTDFIE